MPKQYRKHNNLILPDDELVLPKPDLLRPWYAGRITANRGMSRRKCCCGGYNCGVCSSVGDDISADFTSGTLSNNNCNNCTSLNASYILTFNLAPGSTTCSWSYQGTVCIYNTKQYYIGVSLSTVGASFGKWKYQLHFHLHCAETFNQISAYYYSEEHDQGGACVLPDTLTLDTDNIFNIGNLCSGNLPTEVELT